MPLLDLQIEIIRRLHDFVKLRILVNAVNARPGMAAERGFLPAPEMCDALREARLPMFSIESCAPLAAFDVIGITLPHELAEGQSS